MGILGKRSCFPFTLKYLYHIHLFAKITLQLSSFRSCLCLFVYAHMCVCVSVCMCVGVCVCLSIYACVQKSESDVKCLPQSLSTLLFLRQEFPLNLELTDLVQLDWLGGKPREHPPPCLHLSRARSTGTLLCLAFWWVLEIPT